MNPSPNKTSIQKAPYNLEAEQAVLGSIMLDPTAMTKVAGILSERDFYIEKHGWVFEAMKKCSVGSEPIDVLILSSALESAGKLKELGGMAYLVELLNTTLTAAFVEKYAQIVKQASTSRRYIAVAGEIARLAYNNDLAPDALAGQVQSAVLAVAPKAKSDGKTVGDAMSDVILDFRLRVDEPADFVGLRTGLLDWDNKFGGLVPGLYVLAGQSSHGKTSLALALARGCAGYGHRGVFLSLEMPERQLSYRLLARESGISTTELMSGWIDWQQTKRRFNPDEITRVERAAERLHDLPLVIRAESGITSLKARSILTEEKMKHGLDFAVVDYLHLLLDESGNDNEVKALDNVTRNMLQAAQELQIPLILLSQVSRGVENRQTHLLTMSDMRGSGRIEENSDVIVCATNEDRYHMFNENRAKDNTVAVYGLKDRLSGRIAGASFGLTWIERTGAVVNKAK